MPTSSHDGKTISRLYKGVDGYTPDSPKDNRRFLGNRASVYGELTTLGVKRLIKHLNLTSTDVFYDLGAGVGKVVMQIGMSVPLKKCVGIEMVHSRWLESNRILKTVKDEKLIQAAQMSFRNANFLESNIADATVIYACSTCFSTHLMQLMASKIKDVKRTARVVTLREFDRKHRGFQFLKTVKLDATWSPGIEAYVYQVTPK